MDRNRIWALREVGHVQRAHCCPHHGSYNLAQHCWHVETLLLLLHPSPSRELLIAAHWHDAPERWTGDVPGPAKWMDGADLEAVLTRTEERIRLVTGLVITLTDQERHWLKVCDRLELWMWCADQMNLGNNHVSPMWRLLRDAFKREWNQLPREIQVFLDNNAASDKYPQPALNWRRTPDTGYWQDQVNGNLLPGRK